MATPTALQTTGLLNLEKELVCFICTEILFQPLTLIDCLHTFCGSCLKEWFSHQHRKASHSHSHSTPAHPYTCPTCRATVKDVQHNAMINTLLEMFLSGNPDKDRSAEEKVEMTQVYKAGDNILPKVESRRKERRRRDEDGTDRRDRRSTDGGRDQARRQGESSTHTNDRLAPPNHERSGSRSGSDHDDRRDRRIQERNQRRAMRDRVEAAEARLQDQAQESDHSQTLLAPPPSSPRHPDAVEARSRARTVAHQASIRSLVSASDSGTGTGESLDEAQLMQEILAEGLLDGIDVDSLTEAEQDRLSEDIAERYRQLHRRRSQRPAPEPGTGEPDGSASVATILTSQLEEADRLRNPARGARSRVDAGTESRSNGAAQLDERRPQTSSAQTPQREHNLSPPNDTRTHRRRASDQNAGQQSPRAQPRGEIDPATRTSATRSATDLSERPRSSAASAEVPHRLSNTDRAQTEPRQTPTASELWARSGVTISRNRAPQTDSPPHLSPSVPNATVATTIPRSVPAVQTEIANKTLTVSTSFEEPELSCFRCQRKGIQYEVFKHCTPCDVDLCLRCYRTGRGCNHWFGFGHAAMTRFHKSHPRNRASQQMELPHLLMTRQYTKPPSESTKVSDATTTITTTSDPTSRLLEGHFCDRCGSFANSCFWTCDYCNDGEWGFCTACANTHHTCTHPLLPIAHKDFAPGSPNKLQPVEPFANNLFATPGHSAPSSANSTADRSIGPRPDYVQLSITTHCDICTQPIPPAQARYHCPSHPTPTPQNPKSMGDYDICTSCYHNLVKIGRLRRDDGPAGWRKCPNGHRMIVTEFENDSDGGQRRHIVNDLVGGVKMTDEHIQEWTDNMQSAIKDQGSLGAQLQLSRGKWTWNDPAEAEASTSETSSHRRVRSRQATINPHVLDPQSSQTIATTSPHKPSLTKTSKFPPNGGFGRSCVGLWSYYPEDGVDGRGELMFPKGAEITEIEDINDEWSEGVYAGDVGVLAKVYVADVEQAP